MSDLEKAASYLVLTILGIQKSVHNLFLGVVTSSLLEGKSFTVFGKLAS